MNFKQKIYLSLSVLAALGLLYLAVWLSGVTWTEMSSALAQAGWGAFLLVGLALTCQLAGMTYSWRSQFSSTLHHVTARAAFTGVTIGWAFNTLTPSMYVGGEPARALILSKLSQIPFAQSMGSVLISKFLELTSFITFLLFSASMVFWYYRPVLLFQVQAVITVILVFLIAFVAVTFWAISQQFRGFTRLASHLKSLGLAPQFWERHLPHITEMENTIIEAFHRHPRSTWTALLFMIFFHLSIFFRPLAFFALSGRPLTIAELGLVFLLIQLVQALQFTPGGIGILEGGTVAIFSLIEISPSATLAFVAFWRFWDFAYVTVGLGFSMYYGMHFWKQPEAR